MSAVHTVWKAPVMSYTQAMKLLDRRRRGVDIDEQEVLKALELTGDYTPDDDFKHLFVVDSDDALRADAGAPHQAGAQPRIQGSRLAQSSGVGCVQDGAVGWHRQGAGSRDEGGQPWQR